MIVGWAASLTRGAPVRRSASIFSTGISSRQSCCPFPYSPLNPSPTRRRSQFHCIWPNQGSLYMQGQSGGKPRFCKPVPRSVRPSMAWRGRRRMWKLHEQPLLRQVSKSGFRYTFGMTRQNSLSQITRSTCSTSSGMWFRQNPRRTKKSCGSLLQERAKPSSDSTGKSGHWPSQPSSFRCLAISQQVGVGLGALASGILKKESDNLGFMNDKLDAYPSFLCLTLSPTPLP